MLDPVAWMVRRCELDGGAIPDANYYLARYPMRTLAEYEKHRAEAKRRLLEAVRIADQI